MSQSVDAATVLPTGEAPTRDATQPVHVAGFWHRLAAAAVDSFCLAPAVLLLVSVAFLAAGPTVRASLQFDSLLELFLAGGGLFYGLFAVAILIVLVYGFLFTVTTGATPGLRLLRLRVIDIYGESPQCRRAATRSGALLLGSALFGLGLFWIAFDREKRGLHDWMAGTYVIHTSTGDRPTRRTAA